MQRGLTSAKDFVITISLRQQMGSVEERRTGDPKVEGSMPAWVTRETWVFWVSGSKISCAESLSEWYVDSLCWLAIPAMWWLAVGVMCWLAVGVPFAFMVNVWIKRSRRHVKGPVVQVRVGWITKIAQIPHAWLCELILFENLSFNSISEEHKRFNALCKQQRIQCII